MNPFDADLITDDDLAAYQRWCQKTADEALTFRADHPEYDDADERRFLAQHGLSELPF
jgi:hypothetical protein